MPPPGPVRYSLTHAIHPHHPNRSGTRRVLQSRRGPRAGATKRAAARYVGVNELGLGITTVWASKADSDRFTSERLFPAIRQVFGNEPGEPMAMVGYEAADELVIETTS